MDLSDKYLQIDIINDERKVCSHEKRNRFTALIDKYSSKYLITFFNNELKCIIKFNKFNSKVISINTCFNLNFYFFLNLQRE